MRLVVQVKTLSKETRIVSERSGSFTMYVAAPPVKEKANRQIVKWISKRLGKSSSQVRIVAGIHSNTKTIEIIGSDEAEVSRALSITRSE